MLDALLKLKQDVLEGNYDRLIFTEHTKVRVTNKRNVGDKVLLAEDRTGGYRRQGRKQ